MKIAVLILIVTIFIIYLISHIYYKRSFMATISELFLRISLVKKKSKKQIDKEIKRCGKKPLIPFWLHAKKGIQITFFSKMPIVTMKKRESSTLIFYLHGGGYVKPITIFHFHFLKKVLKSVDAEIIIPLYLKAPRYTYKESYQQMIQFYQDLLSKNPDKKIIMMGDSAGGGFAAALCEIFERKKMKLPDRLILFSPWLTMCMEDKNYEYYEKKDPSLSFQKLQVWIEAWTRGEDRKNTYFSPLYGKFSTFPEVTLFVGTRELLYLDSIAFYEKLNRKKMKVSLHIGKGLNHDYVLFPIPEAKGVLHILKSMINES